MMIVLILLISGLSQSALAKEIAPPPEKSRSHIDLVIALDTSNSMDGLINSARQKVWDLVNEMATAKPTPILRVGLISFGNDGYRESGWTRIDQGLTSDLDAIYEKLMALKTNGGTEYVGRAIHTARTQMDWRKDRKSLKIIFVAGNESADQDMEFRAVKEAGLTIEQDIIVNTIYCGNDSEPESRSWREVAMRADGQFANIARDGGAIVINTPFDKKLNALSAKLNKTYIGYGSRGMAKKKVQASMDMEANSMSDSAGAARAAAKASPLYRNEAWDIVDAVEGGRVKVEEMKREQLPPEMQGMSPKERLAYVGKMKKKRAKIQGEIAELNKKRSAFIKKKMAKRGQSKDSAFDIAVGGALRKQARTKGIIFSK
jgi:hypothetical protein